MTIARYAAYRESGISGVGLVPSHWITVPFKRLVRIRNGRDYKDVEVAEAGYPVYGSGGRFAWAKDYLYDGESVLLGRKGTVDRPIFVDSRFWTVDTMFYAEVSPKISARFAYYCALTIPFALYSTNTALPSMTQETLGNHTFAIPGRVEQAAIANFLDRETAKIDTLIEKHERLIELLEEKRQAVISQAVTKGLSSDVRMRDSGAGWLGEVPETWSMKCLTYLVDDARKITYGIVLPGPNVEDGVPIVKGGDVKPGRLRLERLCRTTREIEAQYARSRLKAGDLVYSIRGTIGDVEIVPAEIEGANLTQDAARIAPKSGVCNRWLRYAMEAHPIYCQLEVGSLGAAVRGVNIRDLKRALIPVPRPEEMVAIADHLDEVLNRLESLVNRSRDQVSLLRERRTALISAAVTGKIDVRSVV